jgi:thiosulfate/3-mercaptopyruvate sulfurtransferase
MHRTPQTDTRPTLLVQGDWLAAHLGGSGVRILDVRGRHPSSPLPHAKRAEFDATHIPGAVFVDWATDFVNREDPVPYQLADPDQFAADAGALGLSPEDIVVTYDDYYGLHDARVLDGGWRTWFDEGRAITDAPSEPRPTTFPVCAPNALRLSLDDLDRARGSGAAVVDARPRHLYLGEPGAPGTGHIPGAYTLSYQELVDGATGLFQSPTAIRRLVVAAGIDPDDPPAEVVTTCGIGVSATVAMIALELIGIPVRGVYDGAWSEWSADRARPVAFGAG